MTRDPDRSDPDQGSLHVLLAEDDEILARTIVLALMGEWADAEITTVGDGILAAQALERRDSGFDIVILDIMLPGKGGLSVLGHARRHRPNTPIVAMTGAFGALLGEAPVLHTALQLGASAVMTKPFSAAELLGTVKSVLRRADAWDRGD